MRSPRIDVVAHADFVSVINDRRAGKRHEQPVHEFDPAAVIVQQRSQAAADADIDPHVLVAGILIVHVIPLHIGDHFQSQLVVVAQEQAPLARRRNLRSLLEDFGDGLAVFQLEPHEHSGHQREMERHVKFVALAEIGAEVGGPLVGFGQQHFAGIIFVELSAQFLEDGVGFGQIFAGCAFAFDQVRNRVQAEAVHAQFQPELHHLPHLFADGGIVVVEIGLVAEKAMPVVGLGNRVQAQLDSSVSTKMMRTP